MAGRFIHGQEIKVGWGRSDWVGYTNPVTPPAFQRPVLVNDSDVCACVKNN
jgi:hypothetical protein